MIGYFRRLWFGEFPLSRVFWSDMLVVGTLVNLLTLLVAILLFTAGAPIAFGVAIYLAHIPYNIVVFTGVWRSAAREPSEWSWLARMIAVGWLIAGFLV